MKESVSIVLDVPTPVKLHKEIVVKCLSELLGVTDYKIVDNTVFRYERVSYDDYDYVQVHNPSLDLIRRINTFNDVSELLSKKD